MDEVATTLAYYNAATTNVVKRFIGQAQGLVLKNFYEISFLP
jgi:hypothetical protein